ncbi:PocR ligand-binding domain-containing protein [Klebsiella pneumoniae]
MISASTLNSELINKIAQDFAQATSLAVVVVNIHGDEISELFNFTPFCQLMRQHPEHSGRCRMSDRCGGLEASKKDQLCIYRCHAGLTDFSIPLVIAGHLVGFVLCGQVRLSNDVELVDILNVDDRWQDDPALSPYYFSKLFKKYQGIGFNAWVNQQRMASAKELLCHSDWSIASIARNLGFSQTSYFCKVFRQTYQVTPQAFRQQINAGSQTESF